MSVIPSPFPQPAPFAEASPAASGSGLRDRIAAAASRTPNAPLVADDETGFDAALARRHVRQMEAYLRAAGIAAGERVLIAAGLRADALLATTAVLALGATPVLAPVGLGTVDLAAHARAAEAVALIGPTSYGPLQLGEAYLSVAALVDTVRLVVTQGPGEVDGAVDLSTATLLDQPDFAWPGGPDAAEDAAPVGCCVGPAGAPTLSLQAESTLAEAARQLIEAAGIGPGARLLSTLPPTTTASLVAGPYAAWMGGAALHLHGPFDAAKFLAACDAGPAPFLVIPGPLAPRFAEPCLTARLAGLLLIWRQAGLPGMGLPPALACDCPIVDLYAFDDERLVIRRRAGGEAQPLV